MKTYTQRLFDFWTKVKVANAFPGDWESIFGGAGDEFFDIREYEAGDDWRKIDWTKVAEMGKIYVRENIALKDLRVVILLDVSRGMYFHEKPEIVDTILAVIGGAAVRHGFPVGLVAFHNTVARFFPPRSGRAHLSQIARWHIESNTASDASERVLTRLTQFVFDKVPTRSLLVLVSDFLGPEENMSPLRALQRHFDTVTLLVRDPFERDLPLDGEVSISDISRENRDTIIFGPKERALFKKIMEENITELKRKFLEYGIDSTVVDSSSPEMCITLLRRLFSLRKARRT